jgi:hypothetical protein
VSYCIGRGMREDLAVDIKAVAPQCRCCCHPPTRSRADSLTTPVTGRPSKGNKRKTDKEEAGGNDEAPLSSSSSSELSPGQGGGVIASCLRQGPTTL